MMMTLTSTGEKRKIFVPPPMWDAFDVKFYDSRAKRRFRDLSAPRIREMIETPVEGEMRNSTFERAIRLLNFFAVSGNVKGLEITTRVALELGLPPLNERPVLGWHSIMSNAVASGNPEAFGWLHENGFHRPGRSDFDPHVGCDYDEQVTFFKNAIGEPYGADAMRAALKRAGLVM
jgi:hypothetical protein